MTKLEAKRLGAIVAMASSRRGWACKLISSVHWFSSLSSRKGKGKVVRVPVCIVGGGPVGLVLSILLQNLGIQSLVIEKRNNFSKHPQAHFINNRTMEIFRKLDGLDEKIQVLQPPVDHWRRFVYCTSLLGPLLGDVDHLRNQDDVHIKSPTWVAHFSQNKLLSLLCEEAERVGLCFQHPSTDSLDHLIGPRNICMGSTCLSIESTPENVVARTLVGGKESENIVQIASEFLVAADGAASDVRKLMALKMEGERGLQSLISIHFFSSELGEYLVKHRPGMLYFVFNNKAIGVFVAHDLRSGEFIVQLPFYPPQQKVEDFTPEVCRNIIHDLAGLSSINIDVKAVKPWIMHAEVVDRYVCGHGRVILAGDAAHRFPPAGGFGMNTGIQDAHNLAWKLAAIINGTAPLTLLSTYETERRPIAQFNTALSVSNYKAAMSIPSALGLSPSAARFVHEAINRSIGSFVPLQFQKALLEGMFALGQTQVSPLFLNRYNPIGSSRLQKISEILSNGQSLQLQFPAEDLGFKYTTGSLVSEADSSSQNEDVPDAKKKFCCEVGARLPHMDATILDDSLDSAKKNLCSTLDLTTGRDVEFLMFVGCNKSGCEWGENVLHLAKSIGLLVKVVMVWTNELRKPIPPGILEKGGIKGFVHIEGVSDNWWDLCQVPHTGAILVRPDDHVAWISRSEFQPHSIRDLKIVFSAILKINIV